LRRNKNFQRPPHRFCFGEISSRKSETQKKKRAQTCQPGARPGDSRFTPKHEQTTTTEDDYDDYARAEFEAVIQDMVVHMNQLGAGNESV
jgi:hypothetical protein